MPSRATPKIARAISVMLAAHDARRLVTCMDAFKHFGDTCWPTTVSQMRQKGLKFEHEVYHHENADGGQTRMYRYRLTADSVEPARRLLAGYHIADAIEPQQQQQEVAQ